MALLKMDGLQTHGWPLTCLTVSSQAALLADLRERLASGVGFAVATMNLDHVVKLRCDPAFRQAYTVQSHVTADGRPIVWMAALAGRRVQLVAGSDFVEPLIAICAQERALVAIVGSTEDVLKRAADVLRTRHPGLVFAALIAPPMGFDPDGSALPSLLDDLDRAGARVCFLALGAPKQEIFAARAVKRLPGMGFVSVGAGIDFVAGAQVRAPRLIRALALEWAWRLAGDPRRLLRRYAACFAVLPALVRAALVLRLGRHGKAPE